MIKKSHLSVALAAILVAVTLPLYLTIGGLSLMAFDAGFSGWAAATSGGIIGTCVLIPLLSLVFAIRNIRKGLLWQGIGISLVPAAALGVFWLWLSQQSFS